ncbi:hypothetical protein EGW08_002079 [Elysia chlorotica]|uniref:Nicastrin n=1 Tax=Elysia chlorotica TaxID=188477 RepID=A0A3S0ZZ27_ELYCH|nr:hypothetical protein EGW08_002079 [Elysia chlorotica]
MILVLGLASAESARIRSKIYIDLLTQSACFRTLNATHQLGCASSQSGNVGIVHYLRDATDFDWVLNKGNHPPYIVVMNTVDFTGENVRRLSKRSDRVNGIMVISLMDQNTTSFLGQLPPDGFSYSDTCPNDAYGIYRDSKTYGGCKKTKWNLAGSGLMQEDVGIPVFALSEESDVNKVLHKCFFKFNQDKRNETCFFKFNQDKRNETCFFKFNQDKRNETCFFKFNQDKRNETCFFKFNQDKRNETVREYPLCAAELRTEMWAAVSSDNCIRRSNRLVSQITDLFCDPLGDQNNFVTMMDLSETETRPNDSVIVVGARIKEMIDGLTQAATGTKVVLQEADANQPLPPASAQRFLMERADIPVVVVTDHQKEFTNKYYNSRLDLPEFINADYPPELSQAEKYDHVTEQAGMIADVATALARYLYKASTGDDPDQSVKDLLTANSSTHNVNGCVKSEVLVSLQYTVSVWQRVKLSDINVGTQPLYDLYSADVGETSVMPYPTYVGVYRYDKNAVASLVLNLMARFTGDLYDLDKSECLVMEKDVRYSYTYMQGNLQADGKGRQGWCFKSLVHSSNALSPAFQIDDYDMKSGKYSTWAESRWDYDSFHVRLFLLPSDQLQTSIFAFGVVVFVLSLVIAYWCNANSSRIFARGLNSPGAQTTYSPML